jgi:hypothetical protein
MLLQPPSQEHVFVDRKPVPVRERQGISIAGEDSHTEGLYAVAIDWPVLPTAASPALFSSNGRTPAAGGNFLFRVFLRENAAIYRGQMSPPSEWHATCTVPASIEIQSCEC